MAKAKSKEFILYRSDRRAYINECQLQNLKSEPIETIEYFESGESTSIALCHKHLSGWFGLHIKPGEKKRIRITIEEVK